MSDKNIKQCIGCHACQNIGSRYGCVQDDDVGQIMDQIIRSDCVVYATPIYTWYCTPANESLIRPWVRSNKFYGTAKGSFQTESAISGVKEFALKLIGDHNYN